MNVQALRTNKILAWSLVLAWMCVIFAFSAQAHSGEITEAYFHSYNFSVRKSAHMCEYAMLFLLSRHAFKLSFSNARSLLFALILCVLYAMTDEFHQSFVPGRSSSINDVGVDSMGSTIALICCFVISKLPRRSSQ